MANAQNYITEDTTIRGDITTASSLTVAGAVEGDINAGGDITVVDDGIVKGDLSGPNVMIAGKVEGKITASGRLVIGASGVVHGDIAVRSLLIEEGGTLEGQCSMGGVGDTPVASTSGRRPVLPNVPPPGVAVPTATTTQHTTPQTTARPAALSEQD